MIIVSSRKFRDNQNAYFEKANTEEVILQTLRYGSFRLVPVRESDEAYSDVRKASEEKNAALVANFHKGESATKKPAPLPVQEEPKTSPAIDIAELVKAAVQEAVAAAVPAAAAAAVQMQQVQREVPEPKPARASRTSKKAAQAKEKDEDRPELVLEPALPDPVVPEKEPEVVEVKPEPEPIREYAPLFYEEPAPKPAASVAPKPEEPVAPKPAAPKQDVPVTPKPVEPAAPKPVTPTPATPQVAAAPKPVAPTPAAAPRPRPVPRVPLSIEDELDDHEPIPEPSDEVKRHIHPVTEASADVKPDFVDPGLYTDYEDSYIVGEERPDLEAQLAAYRKQDKGGFFKRLFKK